MNQLPKILTLLFATLLTSIVLAQDPPKSRAQAEALAASLKYQQGTIDLRHGLASLQVPGQFRFLNGTDANTVLVRLWGNPPKPSLLACWFRQTLLRLVVNTGLLLFLMKSKVM